MELSEVYYNDLGINVPRSKESIIRNAWKKELLKKNYNTLVTLQQPMRNRHQMDSRLKYFSDHQRIGGLFYSVEYNADKRSGYHIHLMFNDLCHVSEKKECTREHLAYLLDIKKSHIQYYESINSKSAVSGYVSKNMKSDQIHYNFHI
jgi:hypothetical protein